MPLERVISKQRTISWGPIGTPMRQIPRRNRSTIQNYSQYERIDELIQNPPRTPKTTTQLTQLDDNGEAQIADGEEDIADVNDSSSSLGEGRIEVQFAETPT
jgi:hypothetical protein